MHYLELSYHVVHILGGHTRGVKIHMMPAFHLVTTLWDQTMSLLLAKSLVVALVWQLENILQPVVKAHSGLSGIDQFVASLT